MIPIKLEGNHLGSRHSQLNEIVNKAFNEKVPFDSIKDLKENSDLDHFVKIDLANKYRNIDYILENIKSDDSIYYSRALKSTWLITDEKYSNIIKPDYLHKVLFPVMSNGAICKLKQAIRVHLNDVKRIEEFYNYYYNNNNKDEAIKYLPKCSVELIEKVLKNDEVKLDKNLFINLARKSPKLIEVALERVDHYRKSEYLYCLKFLVAADTTLYLDLLEKYCLDYYCVEKLGQKSTSVIMKSNKERVLGKAVKYVKILDLLTVGKYISKDEVKDLIVKLSKDQNIGRWFSYKNIKPLLRYINRDERFEFLRGIFEERHKDNKPNPPIAYRDMEASKCMMLCSSSMPSKVTVSNVYEWYRYADFKVAFPELKKLIRTEASADERTAMLRVLVASCRKNEGNVKVLLQYFHDHHINEPKNFKLSFLRSVIKELEPYKFKTECWKVLDELFHNVEVYDDNSSGVENFIQVIVVHHILNNVVIQEKMLEKFIDDLSGMDVLQAKLDKDAKDKIFNFVFTNWKKKVDAITTENKDNFNKKVDATTQMLNFMKDWKVDISSRPEIIGLCQELINKVVSDYPDANLSWFHGLNTKTRRVFFKDMLLLSQEEKVFIHMLKHDPSLVEKHQEQINKVLKGDQMRYKRLLSKLRTYFSESLGPAWADMFEKKLKVCHTESSGAKTVVYSLCYLSDREKFTNLVKEYIPTNYKVKWSEENICVFNLRKYLASFMHLVRPSINIDLVLQFAQGDYLQHALPSLLALSARMPAQECKHLVPRLLDNKVSLQKHGIRIAFSKFPSDEIKDIFGELWKKTKNASIRAVLFQLTFKLMCSQKNEVKVLELWGLMKFFLENLSQEEDRSIYPTLVNINRVPLSVRSEFCNISYKCLKAVPAKIDCTNLFDKFESQVGECIEDIEESFVEKLVLEKLDKAFKERSILTDKYKSWSMWDFPIKYLLNTKTPEDMVRRFDKTGMLIVDYAKSMWDELKDDKYIVRSVFSDFLQQFTNSFKDIMHNKESKYKISTSVFEKLLIKIAEFQPIEKYYGNHVSLKMTIGYFKCYEQVKSGLKDLEEEKYKEVMATETGKLFAPVCGEILSESLENLYPCVQFIFHKKLDHFISNNVNRYEADNAFSVNLIESLISDLSKPNWVMLGIYLFDSMHVLDSMKSRSSLMHKQLQSYTANKEVTFYYNYKFADKNTE